MLVLHLSEDFSLLVTFLLVTFSWLFRGPHLLGEEAGRRWGMEWWRMDFRHSPPFHTQEDVNGEKLTVNKWWIFGPDFSRFTQSFSRFIRDINGEK